MKNKGDLYSDSFIPTMKHDFIAVFGEKKGTRLHQEACGKLLEYRKTADSRNNAALEWHLFKNILPALACYKVLLENGMEKPEAVQFISDELEILAVKSRNRFKKLNRVPFFYPIFRYGVKKVMAKQYPAAGWKTIWKKTDRKEVSFDLTSCFYCETLKKYDAYELCPVFCHLDVTNFSGLQPKIEFRRTQTLSTGGQCCDFRYINNKG